MRLIDADELKETLKTPIPMDSEKAERIWEGWHECTIAVDRAIDAMPTIEPERKKGHWIKLYTGVCKCSECGDWWKNDDIEVFNFCPNCGCDMRQEGEEHEAD